MHQHRQIAFPCEVHQRPLSRCGMRSGLHVIFGTGAIGLATFDCGAAEPPYGS
jgi:hypothetical protein